MAHAQKPDFVFRLNGRVHLFRQGRQFSRLLSAVVCASAVVMVVMLDTPRSEVECKTTGYPLHSPVSPSLPPRASPCAITFQLGSTLREEYKDERYWMEGREALCVYGGEKKHTNILKGLKIWKERTNRKTKLVINFLYTVDRNNSEIIWNRLFWILATSNLWILLWLSYALQFPVSETHTEQLAVLTSTL